MTVLISECVRETVSGYRSHRNDNKRKESADLESIPHLITRENSHT